MPQFTDDDGINLGEISPRFRSSSSSRRDRDGDAGKAALMRAKLAKQRAASKSAPLDDFLGCSKGGAGYHQPSVSKPSTLRKSIEGVGGGGGGGGVRGSISSSRGERTGTGTGMATKSGEELNALMRKKLNLTASKRR